MTVIELRAGGRAEPDVVWERYARPALWSSWSPQIRRVELPDDRIARGTRGRVHGPVGVSVAVHVTAVDETARTWTWTARLGPVRLHLHHTVEPRPGGGTVTRLRVTGPAPVVLAYAPVAQIALQRLVRP